MTFKLIFFNNLGILLKSRLYMLLYIVRTSVQINYRTFAQFFLNEIREEGYLIHPD